MQRFPWDYHPELTSERLVIVAGLIAEGRQLACDLFDEEAGDDGWTLGCRAFQFGRARILRVTESKAYDWLGIVDRSLQLIFTIGGVPVRIYRGDADEPTDRTMRKSRYELRQLAFLFEEFHEGRDLAFRFAVETAFDGSLLGVRFVGLRGESAILNWEVPLGSATGAVGRPATDSVVLPAPIIGVRNAGKKKTGT